MKQPSQTPQAFSLGSREPLPRAAAPDAGRRIRFGAMVSDNYGFGVRVERLVDGTPATRVKVFGEVNGVATERVASLTPGDTIATANGVRINNIADFLRVLADIPAGGMLRIEGSDGGDNLKSRYKAEVQLDD